VSNGRDGLRRPRSATKEDNREVPDARLRRPHHRARRRAGRDRRLGRARLRGGKPFVTDGPFAETKEFVAGFDILECDSDEEALAIAQSHPVARFGAIEVRAFYDA
jgi:hypothetical protein